MSSVSLSLSFFFFTNTIMSNNLKSSNLNSIQSYWFCCCSVVSDSLWPQGLQHARIPLPSPSLGICWNSCPLSRWCHQPSNPLLSPSPPGFYRSIIRVFSNELTLHIRWPKYWSFSFSISPPNEYSGFISFRIDRLISWLSKGLSRVFSNTTAQKHQSFGALPSVSWQATVHIQFPPDRL